jgi:flagellar basal-body rod protein FlgF
MENPSYIALSLMGGLRRQLDVMANNMANVSTPGFQGERITFRTMVSDRARNGGIEGSGPEDVLRHRRRDVARHAPWACRAHRQSARCRAGRRRILRPRDRRTACATRAPAASAPTPRAASPTAAAPSCRAKAARRSRSRRVKRRSRSTAAAPSSARTARSASCASSAFEDEQALKKTGGSLLETEAEPVAVDGRTRVAQGMIEGSNVQAVVEVTQMIELMRRYQSASRLLEQEHERARRSIEKLARVA